MHDPVQVTATSIDPNIEVDKNILSEILQFCFLNGKFSYIELFEIRCVALLNAR